MYKMAESHTLAWRKRSHIQKNIYYILTTFKPGKTNYSISGYLSDKTKT